MRFHRGLLVSTKRNFEAAAVSEISFALVDKLGIDQSSTKPHLLNISGLVSIRISKTYDLLEIMEQLRELESDEQFFFHCLKIKPIELVINAKIEALQEAVKSLDLDLSQSFRIAVTKRHSKLTSQEVITATAPLIDAKVNLTHPDWILLIEILADRAGLTIVKPDHIFSTKVAFESDEAQENWFLN
ncbi:MAG: THUMP domain-containing protein [Candidatus Heimdallarchaeota archaeon]|nr:THUMP domain-containing protein [Candidatus Heimdallarchaeota archaeon]